MMNIKGRLRRWAIAGFGVLVLAGWAALAAAQRLPRTYGTPRECQECIRKDRRIRALSGDLSRVNAELASAHREIRDLKRDKGNLEAEVAKLKAVAAPKPPPPPPPPPKRQITLKALTKMNAAQAKACARCRLSGRVAALAVQPIPGQPGMHLLTAVDPAALTGEGATSRPATDAAIVRCSFAVSVPAALAVEPKKGATMTISGDITRAETLPAGADSPQEIRLDLAAVETGA